MKDHRDSSILVKILASKQASREGTFKEPPIKANKLSRVTSGDFGSCSGTTHQM